MSELNPPWALENRSDHHSNVARMFLSVLAGRAEGVRSSADLAVTQRGAGANMSVDVAKGAALVHGDESEFQGIYGVVNDATVNVVIAAADPTNPRRDLIVARVRDDFYSGATKAWDLTVIQGTPAASPADPTVSNNCLVLARVAVAAAAASIVTANITDLRPLVGSPTLIVNSARPAGTLYGPYSQEPSFKPTPYEGLIEIETDTDLAKVYDGAALVRLGQYAGAWTVITDTLLGSDTTISFTSIPQTFTHLQLILSGRGNAAVAGGAVLLRLNGDTGANYDVNYIGTTAGAPVGTGSDAQTSMSIQKHPGTSATANRSGVGELLFPDYRSTTFQKAVLAKSGYRDGGVGGDSFMTTGQWRNTAAITQIDVHFNAIGTGWKAGTRATLIGIR